MPNVSTNRFISSQKTLYCPRRSISFLADNKPVKQFDNNMPVNPIALEKNFCLREKVYMAFPLVVTDSIIKQAICCFQVNIDNSVKHIKHVCCYYSQFVNLSQLEIFFDNDAVIMAAFKINILYCCNLDICGCCAGTLNFYYNCWT